MGRRDEALGRPDGPARSDPRSLRVHGQRPLFEAEATGHPGRGRLRRAHLPHEPLGLRVHRRRHERRADEARGQARRCDRNGRHRDPVRSASGARRAAGLRLPAHALHRRLPRERAHACRLRRGARARLATAADEQLQHPHERRRPAGRPGRGPVDRADDRPVRGDRRAPEPGRAAARRFRPARRTHRLQEDGARARADRRSRRGPGDRRGTQALVPLPLQAAPASTTSTCRPSTGRTSPSSTRTERASSGSRPPASWRTAANTRSTA